MTYKELDDIIYESFTSIPIVMEVVKDSNKINDKSRRYWAVAYDMTNVIVTDQLMTFTFNFYALERMVDSDDSRIFNYSKGIDILNKGIDNINDIVEGVQYPISFQCSSVKFADILDVVQATVQITIEKSTDCE